MDANTFALVLAGAQLAGYVDGVMVTLAPDHQTRAKELLAQWNDARAKLWPELLPPTAMTTEAAHGAGTSATDEFHPLLHDDAHNLAPEAWDKPGNF